MPTHKHTAGIFEHAQLNWNRSLASSHRLVRVTGNHELQGKLRQLVLVLLVEGLGRWSQFSTEALRALSPSKCEQPSSDRTLRRATQQLHITRKAASHHVKDTRKPQQRCRFSAEGEIGPWPSSSGARNTSRLLQPSMSIEITGRASAPCREQQASVDGLRKMQIPGFLLTAALPNKSFEEGSTMSILQAEAPHCRQCLL